MKIGRGSTSDVRAACVAGACLLLAGCAGGVGGSAGGPHASGGSSARHAASASPVGGSAAEAVAAYRAMWRDMASASATADAQSPRLADHAEGGALALLRFGLTRAQKENVVVKGAPRVDPWVVSAGARSVKLQDCVDGTHWLQYTKAGQLKDNVPGSHNKADATVTYDKGSWKVTDLYLYGAGTC